MDPQDRVVAAQMTCLAALAWPGRTRWTLPRPLAVAAVAGTLAGSALAVAGTRPHGRLLTPRVAPPPEGALHTDGVYAVSRNPIYAGLLVGTLGWAVLRRRPEPLLAWAALLAVLQVKVRREEDALTARFGTAYTDYRARTPRFLGVRALLQARRRTG